MKPFTELLKIPAEPPPVVVTQLDRHDDDTGLWVEEICWDAADGERVPALVVRPQQAEGLLPAVICLHGTGGNAHQVSARQFGMGEWTPYGGKAAHQTLLGWGRELAQRGYLTLALTQRGLDVRLPDTNDRAKDRLVRGRTLMGEIVEEIRQGITYLQQREDVDTKRIGITGISFGGITSFYTWLVDQRLAAAAPICGGVGSVDVLLRQGAPSYHGFYWWIPGMLCEGDQGDYAAAMAPRPLMLWAPLHDIGMPAAGVHRFLQVAAPAYNQAGAPEALVVLQPPGEHALTLEAFDALVDFFGEHLR